jgi:hypothetical protein
MHGYHTGKYHGSRIICVHTCFGAICILYKDHWVWQKKCRLPGEVLKQR